MERTFFGVARDTWLRRAEDAGWTPDPIEAYCPRCGHEVSELGATGGVGGGGCAQCAALTFPWHRVVRMGAYEGVLRDAILEVKFSAWRRLGTEVARTCARSVLDACEEARVDRDRLLIVPIPISRWRRMTRGIDHTGTYARALARELDVPVLSLLRRQHRPAQTGRTLDQRRRNVAKTMFVRPGVVEPSELDGRVVILFDDVMTSGATMREACRALVSWRETEWLRNQDREENPGRGLAMMQIWSGVLAVTDSLDSTGNPGHLTA